jgi:hypothetical protein
MSFCDVKPASRSGAGLFDRQLVHALFNGGRHGGRHAAQEAATPVAQTRIAWPSSGTDMNRVAAAR